MEDNVFVMTANLSTIVSYNRANDLHAAKGEAFINISLPAEKLCLAEAI